MKQLALPTQHLSILQLGLLFADLALVIELLPDKEGAHSHAEVLVGPLYTPVPSVSVRWYTEQHLRQRNT